MLKCEILDTQGFEPAIHGMRNPMNSWEKSDSGWGVDAYGDYSEYRVGQNDMKLMQNLFKAGTEHRKYDRMIVVWMDITAPLYWWKEMDTYAVGVNKNSCSTMHKIHSKEFTLDDFSHEHLVGSYEESLLDTIDILNYARVNFLETKDKKYWWQMIQLLPTSYNQKRTVMLNYEVVARIIQQREEHKLDEWKQFIDVLKTLPYLNDIMNG